MVFMTQNKNNSQKKLFSEDEIDKQNYEEEIKPTPEPEISKDNSLSSKIEMNMVWSRDIKNTVRELKLNLRPLMVSYPNIYSIILNEIDGLFGDKLI